MPTPQTARGVDGGAREAPPSLSLLQDLWLKPALAARSLKIGFLSADLRNHPGKKSGMRISFNPFDECLCGESVTKLCHSEKECPFWRSAPKAPDLRQTRGLKSQRNSPVGRDLKIILRHLRRQPLINHASPHPSRTHLFLYAYALNELPRPPPATVSNPTSQRYEARDRGQQEDREWVEGIRREVERLESLGDVGVAEAAGVIQADEVHVLIDLMGHTRGNRREILAWQVSVVHVTVRAGSCQHLAFFCFSASCVLRLHTAT